MSNLLIHPGPVTEVAINRPRVRNALNTETIEELLDLLAELSRDDGVDVVVLTGTGDKAFCAGADLSEVASLSDPDAVTRYFGNMARLISTLNHLPQPVIGAAFGHVLAGGMGLAAGVDLLVASEDAHFGLPEVKVGLYPMVVTAPIQRLIGARRTLDLSLTGRIIDAETAYAWGLVNRLVAPGRARAEALALAEEIHAQSPLIARRGKEGWRLAQELDTDAAMQALKSLVSLVALTDDSKEGVAAFLQKREPQWPSKQ